MIYLDHNATTPLDERVLEAMLPYLNTFYGNPSSLYRAGRLVRSAVNTAREQVAALVSAAPDQVIFTSGGTEANNLAIKGCCADLQGTIAVSAIEHPSVLEAAMSLSGAGRQVLTLPVDASGRIQLDLLESEEYQGLGFLSLMLANNETGVVQDLAPAVDIFKDRATLVHTDAVQAAGRLPIAFGEMDVNLMTLSSHKIYGPKGCGALIVQRNTRLAPLLTGGGQEYGLRSGTENVPGIIGFGKAAELVLAECRKNREHLYALRVRMENGLQDIPGVRVFSRDAERLPNTVQFGVPGTDGEMLLMQLDKQGFAVSSGSACASGAGQPSHVLLAMGVGAELAKSALRVSLGRNNSKEDVDKFLIALKSVLLIPAVLADAGRPVPGQGV